MPRLAAESCRRRGRRNAKLLFKPSAKREMHCRLQQRLRRALSLRATLLVCARSIRLVPLIAIAAERVLPCRRRDFRNPYFQA
jgi:hypothetical protein